MSRRWLEKLKAKVKSKDTNQELALPAGHNSSSSPGHLPVENRLASRPASAVTSLHTVQQLDALPLRSPHERVWDEAYDKLKENEPKLAEAYEAIISAEIHRDDDDSVSTSLESGTTDESRHHRMKQMIQKGLERTEKDASIKQNLDKGLQVVQTVKEMIDRTVRAAPEAAIAWAGVCLGLEVRSVVPKRAVLVFLLTVDRSFQIQLQNPAIIAKG